MGRCLSTALLLQNYYPSPPPPLFNHINTNHKAKDVRAQLTASVDLKRWTDETKATKPAAPWRKMAASAVGAAAMAMARAENFIMILGGGFWFALILLLSWLLDSRCFCFVEVFGSHSSKAPTWHFGNGGLLNRVYLINRVSFKNY